MPIRLPEEGSLCYLNTALQLLYSIIPPGIDTRNEIVRSIVNLCNSENVSFNYSEIARSLCCRPGSSEPEPESDASEMFGRLLHLICDELKTEDAPINSIYGSERKKAVKGAEQRSGHGAFEESIQFEETSSIICGCGDRIELNEVADMLYLDITNSSPVYLSANQRVIFFLVSDVSEPVEFILNARDSLVDTAESAIREEIKRQLLANSDYESNPEHFVLTYYSEEFGISGLGEIAEEVYKYQLSLPSESGKPMEREESNNNSKMSSPPNNSRPMTSIINPEDAKQKDEDMEIGFTRSNEQVEEAIAHNIDYHNAAHVVIVTAIYRSERRMRLKPRKIVLLIGNYKTVSLVMPFLDILEIQELEQQNPQELRRIIYSTIVKPSLIFYPEKVRSCLVTEWKSNTLKCSITWQENNIQILIETENLRKLSFLEEPENIREIILQYAKIVETTSDVSLERCLAGYNADSLIEGWECEKCEGRNQVRKQCRITQANKYFIITLKRFESVEGREGDLTLVKNQTRIAVQPVIHLCGQEYELIGFSSHTGNLDNGHYVACIKENGYWLECNNNEIISVGESRLKQLEAEAQTLIFERMQ